MKDNTPCKANLLLINHSKEKVKVSYGSGTIHIPKIGLRPPYYCNPSEDPYLPII